MNSYYSNSTSNTKSGSIARPSVVCHVWQGAIIAAGGVVLSLSMAGNAGAGGLGCDANFKITNEKSKAVKVLSLIYQVKGKEHTEGLSNRKLSSGEEHTWKNQSLGKLAEHNAMEKIRIEYRNDTSGEGKISSPWGPAEKTIWFTEEVAGDCTNDRTYDLRIP